MDQKASNPIDNDALAHQLISTQEQVMHLDQIVRQLNDVILEQQHRLDALDRELKQLRLQLEQSQQTDDLPPILEEKPPHYLIRHCLKTLSNQTLSN